MCAKHEEVSISHVPIGDFQEDPGEGGADSFSGSHSFCA